MNLLVVLPFIMLGLPFITTIFEIFRRKDKGPREFPEQTTYEEKPDIDTPLLEKEREKARIKFTEEVLRVTGDISIPDGTEMNNHLVVQGNLIVGRKCHIHGSVKAFGNIEVREASIIEGHLLSEGNITIKRDSVVKGIVDSVKDITLGENVIVEAVSTERTVKIGPNAKINQRILSGSSIITLASEMKEEGAEKPEQVSLASTLEPSKIESESEKIFSCLEGHIESLDEAKPQATEDYPVEGLSPLEVKVFKAALKCHAIEEICLRLLIDSAEAERILQGLFEKGLLDRNFKPMRSYVKKHTEVKPSNQPINILEGRSKTSESELNLQKETEKDLKKQKENLKLIVEEAVKELGEL
ncbi:MAG: hypothetical protein QXR42_03260 [Candidatus Bathyarchaeia archaeon]